MQVRFEGDNVIISKADFMKYMATQVRITTAVGPDADPEEIITDYLIQKGIKRHYKGFHYLKEAGMYYIKRNFEIDYIMKVYQHVADHYNLAGGYLVERTIRTAVSSAYKDKKITAGEFIANMVDDLSRVWDQREDVHG